MENGAALNSPLSDQRRFCERLRGATAEQMRELLGEAQGFTDSFRRRSAREIVMEQMARTDPAAAWAFFETWENGGYRNQFLNIWGRVDAAGALAWAESLGKTGEDYVRDIVAGLVPDDMEAFAKILPRLKPGQLPSALTATAIGLLASADPENTLELLKGLAAGSQRNTASSSLAEGWARRDATAAHAWAENLTDPVQRESALRGVFRAWAETDPEGTAARLDGLSQDSAVLKETQGESPVRAVVQAWAARDPRAAAAWLKSRAEKEDMGSNFFEELLSSEILPARDEWDGAEVAELLRKPGEKVIAGKDTGPFENGISQTSGDHDFFHVIGSFGGYSSPLRNDDYPADKNQALRITDPAKSFEELAKQPGDAARQHVLQEVAEQWVEKDPGAALEKLKQTGDEWLKLGLINALIAQARRNSDPALAEEVAGVFPAGSWQGRSAVSAVYKSIAVTDPSRAMALLQGDLHPDSKSSLAAILASRQAGYDPAGAIAWAAGQGDEKLQRHATVSALAAWAQADAYAASEWLTAQPAGPLREAAVLGLVGALREDSPDDALKWAQTLTDPQQQEQQQMDIVITLLSQDLSKAKQMAAELMLSDSNKKQLRSIIERRENSGQ